MTTSSAAARWSGSSLVKLAMMLSLTRNGKFLNSFKEAAVGRRCHLHRATEPCTDCVAKLNTEFLLIEIKPWLNTGFSLCHTLVECDSISTSYFTSKCCSISVMLNCHRTCNRIETFIAGKYQRCVPFKVVGCTYKVNTGIYICSKLKT